MSFSVECRTENEVYAVESIQTIYEGGGFIRFSAINVPLNLLRQLWSEEQLCPAGLLQPDLCDCWCWMAMVPVQVVWARSLSTRVLFSSASFIADGTNMFNIFYDDSVYACKRQEWLRALLFMCVENNSSWQNGFLCVQMCYGPNVPPGNWFHKTISTILSLLKSQFSGQLGKATLVFIRSINALKTNTKERLIVLVNSYMYFSWML